MDAFGHIVQAVIVIGAMCGIFLVLYLLLGRTAAAARKMAEEEDLTPLEVLECGGKFDADEYRWPWVKLRFYEDFLVVSYRTPFKIPYTDIDRIEVQRSGMQEVMTIHHRLPRIPQLIELRANSVSQAAKVVQDRLPGSPDA